MKTFSISLIIAGLILVSCNEKNLPKENKGSEISIMDVIKNTRVIERSKYNDVQLYATSVINKFAGGSVRTFFKQKEGGQDISYSNLVINSLNLSPDYKYSEDNILAFTYYDSNLGFKNLFNHTITISMDKSTSVSRTTTSTYEVYNPKLIKITNAEDIIKFSTSKSLLLLWDIDPDNKDQPLVLNMILRSIGVDEKPATSDASIVKIIKDSGAFTVESSDLSIFPMESRVDILLYRGNQVVLEDNLFSLYNCDAILATTTAKK